MAILKLKIIYFFNEGIGIKITLKNTTHKGYFILYEHFMNRGVQALSNEDI